MALLVVLGILVVLVAIPVVRALSNPIVNVADELRTTQSYVEVDAEVAALLGRARGYDLRMAVPGTYSLSYRTTPAWALVLGVLTFPVGLLVIFLARETLTLTVSVTGLEPGARIVVVGRSHTKVAIAVGEALQKRFVSAALVPPV